MGISRLHIALLAVMSIFTGIIAPVTSTDISSLAYPMTDARVLSYVLLFFLIIGFYTASIHSWRWFRYNSILIFGIIGLLFFLTLSGQITETKTGYTAHGLSWGWIFLGVGVGLLFRAYRGNGESESPSELRQTIDTLLGIVGSFTLACITGVIVLASFSFTHKNYQESILEGIFGTGGTHTMSGGIVLSSAFTDIHSLSYDRKNNTLLLSARNGKDWNTSLYDDGKMESVSGTFRTPLVIGGRLYEYDEAGRVYANLSPLSNTYIIGNHDTLISGSGHDWNIVSPKSAWSFDYSGTITHPIISGDSMTIAWSEAEGSGYIIKKMGKQEGEKYEKIYSMNLSTGGYDLMSLVGSGESLSIVKNGMPLWTLPKNYKPGSYISNGSHSLYIHGDTGTQKIVFDGQDIQEEYKNIREVFLEKNGGSYAYFAEAKNKDGYCLYTRYRGILCGLGGYMNPIISADGTSIIYAGYTDGNWGIYRNTELLIRNTGYENTDISHDYVFFDATNPRTYLFVKKDTPTGKYILIKNGKTLPGLWDDFGTDVSFGYDNHIILKLKDSEGWKVAEI